MANGYMAMTTTTPQKTDDKRKEALNWNNMEKEYILYIKLNWYDSKAAFRYTHNSKCDKLKKQHWKSN